MDLPNSNYLVWHFTQAFPAFVASRLEKFSQSFAYFNLSSLLKNLFAPYRRMTLVKTAPGDAIKRFLDKLSFELISRTVGAIVRIIFVLVGIICLSAYVLFDLVSIIFYLPPIFSLPQYLAQRSQFILDKEAKDPQTLLNKLAKTPYVQTLSLFFEDDFQNLFTSKFTTTQALPLNPQVENVILSLFKNATEFQKYLEAHEIKPQDFDTLMLAVSHHLNPQKIKVVTPLGGLLTFGYTNTLDMFSQRIYPLSVTPSPQMEKTIVAIQKILTRSQNNNTLLVGEPGVGRHTTLNYLALALQDPKNKGLFGKRLLMLDTVAIAGRGQNTSQIKSIFEDILEEANTAGGIILAIDQIDRIVSTKDDRIDISQVITTILKDAGLPIVGITTIDDFSQYVRPNATFLKYFEKVEINEPDSAETLGILIDKTLYQYAKTKVSATISALLEIIQRSSSLIPDQKQPEKSLSLLQDAISAAQENKKDKVDIEIVDQILSIKTKTPLGQITKSEAKKLKDLETVLHQRIIGQDQAINELASAMRRARSGIEGGKRPIGSFLFLGPTGVGKTETAKALAQSYFGDEEKMVRLDMSEFQGADALNRLIGDSKSKTPGELTNLIRQNPYGLLLIDEFEKAEPAVNNLFLQILDEGFLTDAFGKKVSFTNNIIIATSNAGAEFIREQVKGGKLPTSKELLDYVLKKGIFTPELVNRFDGVIVYTPLSKDQAASIAGLMLAAFAKKLKETKNVTLEITPELSRKVAEKGYDQEFGARPIRRLIQDKIEDPIAKMIIDGTAKNGSKIPAASLLKFIS